MKELIKTHSFIEKDEDGADIVIHYNVVILKEDQLDLIAEKVLEKIKHENSKDLEDLVNDNKAVEAELQELLSRYYGN